MACGYYVLFADILYLFEAKHVYIHFSNGLEFIVLFDV